VDSRAPELPAWLGEQLLGRRLVQVVGELDDAVALRVSAELMTLDATGSDPIDLHFASSGDRLESALTIVDTLDLLEAPTRAHAVGDVSGAAVAVFAACRLRTAAAHAGFQMREPRATFAGDAEAALAWSERQTRAIQRFRERLAAATGQSVDTIAQDLRRGRYLETNAALAYGLLTASEARPRP